MLCGAKHLILVILRIILRLYSGSPLPVSQRSLAILKRVAILSGQAQISWLEGPVMTNTPYIAFAFLEQLLSEYRYHVQ